MEKCSKQKRFPFWYASFDTQVFPNPIPTLQIFTDAVEKCEWVMQGVKTERMWYAMSVGSLNTNTGDVWLWVW